MRVKRSIFSQTPRYCCRNYYKTSWCFQENTFLHSKQASLYLGCLHHFNTCEAESVHTWQHSSIILCRYKLAQSLTIALIYLARSAKWPNGLYILPSVISFFFIFFNDFSETNYLKIRWTNFCNLYVEWKLFGVDDRSGPLFFDISREFATATDFVQKWGKIAYPPAHITLSFRNGMG